ncbi:MAG TPA: response regulator transcription factor [Actinomycetota bacterium]
MASTIRVLLVDDQALVRTGFRMILAAAPDLEVVGEAGDGAEAVELAQATRPDVVLMDVRMPGVDGIEATRRIRQIASSTAAAASVAPLGDPGAKAPAERPAPRVLILTTFDLDEYVFDGLRAGASGFLLKDSLAPDLLAAIRVVASGDAVVAPAITRRLLERFIHNTPAPDRSDTRRLEVLTPREREVLELIGRGCSNAEIAERLYLSEGTVKTHVSRVLAKLGLRDRVHAVILAYETGLIRAGDAGAGDGDGDARDQG